MLSKKKKILEESISLKVLQAQESSPEIRLESSIFHYWAQDSETAPGGPTDRAQLNWFSVRWLKTATKTLTIPPNDQCTSELVADGCAKKGLFKAFGGGVVLTKLAFRAAKARSCLPGPPPSPGNEHTGLWGQPQPVGPLSC
ncbi:hypothetical protein Ddc_09233 [Ditylenchus destructor]|nr:hypothetical protein Ddc_09233 [Ditylenchus destructor]